MKFKLRNEKRGGHVHIDVFVGPDEDHLALAGTLVMRAGEAAAFEAHFPKEEENHEPERPTRTAVTDH
jgi:hypothetical protein